MPVYSCLSSFTDILFFNWINLHKQTKICKETSNDPKLARWKCQSQESLGRSRFRGKNLGTRMPMNHQSGNIKKAAGPTNLEFQGQSSLDVNTGIISIQMAFKTFLATTHAEKSTWGGSQYMYKYTQIYRPETQVSWTSTSPYYVSFPLFPTLGYLITFFLMLSLNSLHYAVQKCWPKMDK